MFSTTTQNKAGSLRTNGVGNKWKHMEMEVTVFLFATAMMIFVKDFQDFIKKHSMNKSALLSKCQDTKLTDSNQ